MIHEVMILDHSGPDLAAVQYGSAIKLVVLAGLIASIVNPLVLSENEVLAWGVSLGIMAVLFVVVGLIESWFARLKMKAIPAYAVSGVIAGLLSLLTSILSREGVM